MMYGQQNVKFCSYLLWKNVHKTAHSSLSFKFRSLIHVQHKPQCAENGTYDSYLALFAYITSRYRKFLETFYLLGRFGSSPLSLNLRLHLVVYSWSVRPFQSNGPADSAISRFFILLGFVRFKVAWVVIFRFRCCIHKIRYWSRESIYCQVRNHNHNLVRVGRKVVWLRGIFV